jgi:hypothetical protein
MEIRMRRSIIALGALITAVSIFHGAGPARAEIDYPVCRSGGGEGGSYLRCDFTTLEQCQATASGIGGSCIVNPFYRSDTNSNNANATYRGHARHVH